MVMRDLNFDTKVGLKILAQRWYAVLLIQLQSTHIDFMTIRNQVRGLSTLHLLTTLVELEQMGLVAANDHYQYQLTAAGLKAQELLRQITVLGHHELNQLSGRWSL
ncbi:winged helix-turn-helix transcriptional regulator [Lentilactobacillus kribbianus]|uniref:winged helix-turn-helix transcriptional regulator n=1 Tax=Lentilactobacillus kribbianus TaxID=2729622 RepID=UPI0015575542|nr:winged helix-turn-helix transcriptional regulator [Lentilactobacillus kribbianus]